MREKRPGAVVFEAIDVTQEQFDQPILWLLAALLIFMPAAMGCWQAWAEALALAGACGLAVLLGIKLVRRPDVPFFWSWTYLPIALFFALAALQLAPLPAAWIGAVSPKTAATNHALLGDLPDAAQRLKSLRFNFYQEGAWHDIRNLVTVTCVFIVVINVFRRVEQMVQLLWVIAWIGLAEAVLAILQIITGAAAVYWLIPLGADAPPDAGTFFNHNAYSQFINLSAGAMVGLLLLKLDQTFRRHDYEPAEVVEKLVSSDFRSAWMLAAMLAVCIASIFLSLSRSGMLSATLAGIVVGILLAIRGGARGMGVGGWLVGVILVLVFSLIMAGGVNLVQGRIARIENAKDRGDRFELTRDALRAWEDYPAVGMGLGSFRFTFQRYDRTNRGAVASHAEDEYAELLEETGAAGGAIAAAFALMIFASFLRARSRGKKDSAREAVAPDVEAAVPDKESSSSASKGTDPASSRRRRRSSGAHPHPRKHGASPASSLSLGLCFGLVAILVQSAADFGQHFVSVACLTAISCALLINLARCRRRERELEPQAVSSRGSLALRAFVLAGVVVVSAGFLWQANVVRLAYAAYDKETRLNGQLSSHGWQGDRGDFIDMDRAADEAARLRPDDVLFRYWRAMNRWYTMTVDAPIDPVTQNPIFTPDNEKELAGLAQDLQDARWICPVFGSLDSQLGEWEWSLLGDKPEGQFLIRLGFELSPGDATVCFVMATLEGENRDWSDSIKHFRRAAILGPDFFSDAVDLYVSYFHRPDVAVTLADDDVDQLHLVAQHIRALGKDSSKGPATGPATRSTDEAAAQAADERANDLIRAEADRADASAETLGRMGLLCVKRKDPKHAIIYLSRALLLDYGNVDWRLAYARSLAAVGRKDDAMHQAQVMLSAHSDMSEAQDLLDKLSTPTTRPFENVSQ
jgi:tetratricopeptide (TPR) repeat protein